jgi:hypothetical protein
MLKFSFVIICFSLSICANTNAQSIAVPSGASQVDSAVVYFLDLPPGLDTMAFTAVITLAKNKTTHKLQFPNGGTQTTVLIYDSTYLNQISKNPLLSVEPIAKGTFSLKEAVVFDISMFKRTQYYVHYLSCGIGGLFPLTIK